MALGNNMKKSASAAPKKEETKKTVKKKLISKSKSVKPKSARSPRKKVAQSAPSAKTQGKLEAYISNQKVTRRAEVRTKYNHELELLFGKELQFLVFEVNGSKYGVEIDKIREVSKCEELIPTPKAHPHLPGIINFRNRTFVGLDLLKKFGGEGSGEFNYSVVLRHINRVALLLPSIPSTVKINGDLLQPLNDLVVDASVDEVYVKGLFQHQGETIYYLDLGELIRSDKAIVVPDELING